MNFSHNPLLVALDFSRAEEAVRMASMLREQVGGFKVGLELLSGPGPGIIAAIRELGRPVFVDAKLHDIPTTVAAAARRLGGWGARWVSVHASGGEAMVRAAVEGLGEGAGGNAAGILGVSVLTSMDDTQLSASGVPGSIARQVIRLARIAAAGGAEGVIAAPRELNDLAQAAPGLIRVTPGIRAAGQPADDQARTSTAAEALGWGADYLVVGRPITRAADPAGVAASFLIGPA
jgi:orotidine-5'-phosphate decarboxylase